MNNLQQQQQQQMASAVPPSTPATVHHGAPNHKHPLHRDSGQNQQRRREQYKSRNLPAQDSRRQSALQRQKQNRMKKTEAKRLASLVAQQDQQLVLYGGGASAVTDSAAAETGKQRAELEKVFAHELQMPEWMIDIPKDLHGGWFVVARPEGKHCLVISSNGTTVARDRAGRLLHRFQSLLPNGSARSSYGANDYCILDCVMNDDLETIFVVDVICWKGQTMYESSAEFRLFWAQSRIGEVAGLADKVPGVNDFSMSLVPSFECDANGLYNAYTGELNYPRDGLMFFNKEGRYWPGLTPLVLKWKDARTSRFPIDTPDGVNPFPTQTAVLQLESNGNLTALGGQVLGALNAQQIAQHSLSVGQLVRVSVTGVTFGPSPLVPATAAATSPTAVYGNHDLQLTVQGLTVVGKCGRMRTVPDSACRIAFQALARSNPINIDAIAASLTAEPGVASMEMADQ